MAPIRKRNHRGSPSLKAQRPLATVVVGGLLSTLFFTLLALPSLYYVMNRRREEPRDEGGVRDPDELPADSVDLTEKPAEEVLVGR